MERGRVSDEAVKKATGKTWGQWFSILHKAGAKKMSHTEMAHLLSTKHIKNGWWAQMVTVEYERAFKKRAVNQYSEGYIVAVHKTVNMPLVKLQRAWQRILKSPSVQKRQLIDLKSKTKRTMIRYKADVGGVVVSFDERAGGKSRIMVESIRLPTKKSVESSRAFWKNALAKLA